VDKFYVTSQVMLGLTLRKRFPDGHNKSIDVCGLFPAIAHFCVIFSQELALLKMSFISNI
jgi:hypothetical protein